MPTQQETELDQLRTQVAELTEKSRTRKARVTELETANADLQTRLTASDTALTEATIGKPLRDLAAACSPVPDLWLTELRKHYRIELQDGKLALLTQDGKPVMDGEKAVPFEPAAIAAYVTKGDGDEAAVFRHITLGTRSTGGSANNQIGRSQPMDSLRKPDPKEKQAPPSSQFGLR